MNFQNFLVKYAKSLVALSVGLVVIFTALGVLHKQFSGNIVGQWAGKAGDAISGNASGF